MPGRPQFDMPSQYLPEMRLKDRRFSPGRTCVRQLNPAARALGLVLNRSGSLMSLYPGSSRRSSASHVVPERGAPDTMIVSLIFVGKAWVSKLNSFFFIESSPE